MLFSSLALILLFWQWRPLGGVVWDVDGRRSAGSCCDRLFAFGWALVLVATFLINHFDLFGLRQVWLYLRGTAVHAAALRHAAARTGSCGIRSTSAGSSRSGRRRR